MSDNVISIADKLKKDTGTQWVFSMAFSKDGDGWTSEILEVNKDSLPDKEPAEAIRYFSEGLDEMAFTLRYRAEQILESERGAIVASIHVYYNGDVDLRLDKKRLNTEYKKEWLNERIDKAKDEVLKLEE